MTAVLAAAVFALALCLAAVQIGSDAIFSGAADAASLPASLPLQTGIAIYDAIAGTAPAPYAEDMLARAALTRGDLRAAQSHAQKLPASANRSDLLARVALARGDHRTAQRLFLTAGDVPAIDAEVQQLAQRDPRAAYRLELQMVNRLQQNGTHPDAVADGYWRLGVLSARDGRRDVAMTDYRRALDLSPISGKYLISAGFQAYDLRLMSDAKTYFERAINVDPQSADAYAGAGMTALALGDRASAVTFAQRSRRFDPRSHALKTLEAQLR